MRRWSVLLTILAAGAAGFALGQGAPTVQTAQSADYGTYLADGRGMALYMLSSDSAGASSCTDTCAGAWPPLTVEGEPTAAKGVAQSLLSTLQRDDGSMQVQYNGLPLYGFVKDQQPGDTTGQGVQAFGGTWTLVSPYGVAIAPKAADAGTADTGAATDTTAGDTKMADNPMELASLQGEGKTVFSDSCAKCHGTNGGGSKGPAFAGNDDLESSRAVIRQILNGGQFMPRFGDELSDRQVAAVATYIRTSFGNGFGAVTEEEVKQGR